MANYTIIGGDKQEYGPVTGDEIRQWVREGRLDANSLVRGENDTEWRPLSAFPEFSSPSQARGATPPPIGFATSPLPGGAAEIVKTPAISLIIVGGLSVFYSLWILAGHLISPPQTADQMMAAMNASPQFKDPQFQDLMKQPQYQSLVQTIIHVMTNRGLIIGYDLFALLMSGVILWGAVRMLALRNFELAGLAAILAMVPCLSPCPCCLLGLPVGIWALLTLRKPGIKGQFH